MEYSANKKYPLDSTGYKLHEEVGEGVSATVYRALCIPFNEIVAIKILDLESLNNDLDNVRREVHTMGLISHPNLLRAHCSFIVESSLWIVMPFMGGGSCYHIMKSVCPEGFEQPIIATMLYEILKALAYLHAQGHIHRDVKAGNILVDSKGAVKLGDFGVSASMFDAGNRQRSRNTFVGTPCWMAPEVMQQLHGYDFKADIWSFGITALELAHGHAPFSKYPPMKVLVMTLQNAPPRLNYERDKKFSKSFKDIVAACLVKDPKKRPTAENLLRHRFFKHSRPNEFLARNILDGLPSLGHRFRMLKAKEAELLAQNNGLHGDKEQLSKQEYIRGISDWNFDLDDLKKQASLIQDYDVISAEENQNSNGQHTGSCEAVLIGGLPSIIGIGSSSFGSDDTNLNIPLPRDFNSECSSLSWSVKSKDDLPLNKFGSDGEIDEFVRHQSKDINGSLPGDQNFQWNGQFKVSTAGSSLKGSSEGSFRGPIISMTSTSASVLSSLKSILQQNSVQREQTLKLIKYAENLTEFVRTTHKFESFQMLSAIARERELQSQVIGLRLRVSQLVDDLQEQKTKNSELEQQLGMLLNKGK